MANTKKKIEEVEVTEVTDVVEQTPTPKKKGRGADKAKEGERVLPPKGKGSPTLKPEDRKRDYKPQPKRSEAMQLQCEPGEIAKYIDGTMTLVKMPKVDLHDLDAVKERVEKYFEVIGEHDMRPAVAGLALALGVNRQTLTCIKNGRPSGGTGYHVSVSPEVTAFIKNIYDSLESLMEQYMLTGKINPVSGIFLAKNHFGYQDKQEMVLTPNTASEKEYDEAELRKRYLTDSPTLTDSDTDSDSE